eukprot:753865-Hanusia_phi.AAC.2
MSSATPASVTVTPRPRPDRPQSPLGVQLSLETITPLFHTRQEQAAKLLGISLTSLKCACRRLGISRWPYKRGTRNVTVSNASESSFEEVALWFPQRSSPSADNSGDSANPADTSHVTEGSGKERHQIVPPAVQDLHASTKDVEDFNVLEAATSHEELSQDSRNMIEWIHWYINCGEEEEMQTRPFY